MRLDDLPESSNVEDRRGEGGYGGGGGGGFGLPIGGGGIGIGTIIVLGLLGWALGIDPSLLIGGAEQMSRTSPNVQQPAPQGRPSQAGSPRDEMGRFVSRVLGSTEARERVIHDMGQYGGRLHTLDLHDDEVAAIQKELDRAGGRS